MLVASKLGGSRLRCSLEASGMDVCRLWCRVGWSDRFRKNRMRLLED